MRDHHPVEWADAVDFDRKIRTAPGMTGQRFLHPSLQPLDQAPIDRISRREWAEHQIDLFDTIADIEAGIAENGDPDGCSPYGCHSGHSVTNSEAAV